MNKNQKIMVRAPATSANLGPGFDVFGLAYKEPFDIVTVTPSARKGVRLTIVGEGADSIPTDPKDNAAGAVALSIIDEFQIETGCELAIEKGVPPGLGLGSSAASAAATAYALNQLFDLDLEKSRLIQFAAKGEKVTAGVEHADNVAAAVMGGFVLVRSYRYFEALRFDPPPNMGVCIALPKMETPGKKTGVARSVLPSQVSLESYVHNLGNAAMMVAGFAVGRLDIIGRAMVDEIIEPARSSLIPGYDYVKKAALLAGALGVAISGAGPAMLAVYDRSRCDGSRLAEAMRIGFRSADLDSYCILTTPGEGVKEVGESLAT